MKRSYFLVPIVLIGTLVSMEPHEGSSSGRELSPKKKQEQLQNHHRTNSITRLGNFVKQLSPISPKRRSSPPIDSEKAAPGSPKENGMKKLTDKQVEKTKQEAKKKIRPGSADERELITTFVAQGDCSTLFCLMKDNPQLQKTWDKKLRALKHSKSQEDQKKYGELRDAAKKSSSSSSGSSGHSSAKEDN